MGVSQMMRLKRDIIFVCVACLLYLIPAANLIWGEMGFISGVIGYCLGAVVAMIPFKDLQCAYCSHTLLQKISGRGIKYYSLSIPDVCPNCNRDLTQEYNPALLPFNSGHGAFSH